MHRSILVHWHEHGADILLIDHYAERISVDDAVAEAGINFEPERNESVDLAPVSEVVLCKEGEGRTGTINWDHAPNADAMGSDQTIASLKRELREALQYGYGSNVNWPESAKTLL